MWISALFVVYMPFWLDKQGYVLLQLEVLTGDYRPAHMLYRGKETGRVGRKRGRVGASVEQGVSLSIEVLARTTQPLALHGLHASQSTSSFD